MSITDPVRLACQPLDPFPYYLTRGRETFYDPETRFMLRWCTIEEAEAWCLANLGCSPYEGMEQRIPHKPADEQRRLL